MKQEGHFVSLEQNLLTTRVVHSSALHGSSSDWHLIPDRLDTAVDLE